MTDIIYRNLLKTVLLHGEEVTTRNSEVFTHFNLPNVTFDHTPLVTFRKTAWKKAIREMEWFFSGDSKCPEDLLDWWKGQLNPSGNLYDGYGEQLRKFTYNGDCGDMGLFDQIKFILKGLNNNPNSRRLVMTVWNPGSMDWITDTNDNPNTPTCCHSIIVQFFVRNGYLHIKSYQRSADMLLGVPHNWIQSWAMLLYFAFHSGLKPGSLTWMFGDAHIYKEDSHLEVVGEIVSSFGTRADPETMPILHYEPKEIVYDTFGTPKFSADDFYLTGVVPEPLTKVRPKLI